MKAINDTPTPILDGETAFVDFYRNQHQRTFRLARLLTKPVDPTTNTLYTTPSPPLRKHANRTNNPPESSQQPPSNPPSPPSMSQQQPRVLNQHGAQQPSTKSENTTRPQQRFLKPFRRIIESINQRLKAQLDLEHHSDRKRADARARILQRIHARHIATTTTHPQPAWRSTSVTIGRLAYRLVS